MNVQLPPRMDKTEFLGWVQGRKERYELDRGRVVMMTGGSRPAFVFSGSGQDSAVVLWKTDMQFSARDQERDPILFDRTMLWHSTGLLTASAYLAAATSGFRIAAEHASTRSELG